MKIVLSRKGFDSAAGGIPSPILPDCTLLSFPIPANSKTSFRTVKFNGISLETLLTHLDSRIRIGTSWKAVDGSRSCHLDPDLGLYELPRGTMWKPAMGQAGAAASHLRKNAIGTGDVFLFFGWFKQVRAHGLHWEYDLQAPDVHVIFGYLEVGQVFVTPPWPLSVSYHPHTANHYTGNPTNIIFLATDRLTWDKKLPGAGTFKYCDMVQLTKPGHKRSQWNLPDCLRRVSITYHSPSSWHDGYFQAAARGQEFVITSDLEVEEWVRSLIRKGIKGAPN